MDPSDNGLRRRRLEGALLLAAGLLAAWPLGNRWAQVVALQGDAAIGMGVFNGFDLLKGDLPEVFPFAFRAAIAMLAMSSAGAMASGLARIVFRARSTWLDALLILVALSAS